MTRIRRAQIRAHFQYVTARGRCNVTHQVLHRFVPVKSRFARSVLIGPRNAHPRTLSRSSEEAAMPGTSSGTGFEFLTIYSEAPKFKLVWILNKYPQFGFRHCISSNLMKMQIQTFPTSLDRWTLGFRHSTVSDLFSILL